MKVAQLVDNKVVNILEIDELNLPIFVKRGMDLIVPEINSLEIGDYTEDRVIFYRDVEVYNRESEEIEIHTESFSIKAETEAEDLINALNTLGLEE